MLPPFNRAVLRSLKVLYVAYGSWMLGGYAVSFSGSRWAWLALVSCVVLVLTAGGSLVRWIWLTAEEK